MDEAATESECSERGELRALVILVDGELGPQKSDVEMIGWGRTLGRKIIVVATKLDRLPKTRRGAQLDKIAAKLGVPGTVGFSSKEHLGVEDLWRELISA